MSNITTLTGERSNQAPEISSATLEPLGPHDWPRLTFVDPFHTAQVVQSTSTGALCPYCETSLPHQLHYANSQAFGSTFETNAYPLPAHPISESQNVRVVAYGRTWPPRAEHSRIGVASESVRTEVPEHLQAALDDLAIVSEEAQIEQFPIPPKRSLVDAERLIRKLYSIYPARYEVSADPDGAVAIDVRNGRGQWILLLCESDGGALVLSNLEIGDKRRYVSVHEIPDNFLREALDLLKSGTP